MSSRALRRLARKLPDPAEDTPQSDSDSADNSDELPASASAPTRQQNVFALLDSENDSDSSEAESAVPRQGNAFAVLGGSDDSDGSEPEAEQEAEATKPHAETPPPQSASPVVSASPAPSGKKNKKKKKKKSKSGNSSATSATVSATPEALIPFVDPAYRNFNAKAIRASYPVLSIDNPTRDFDPDFELRALLGNVALPPEDPRPARRGSDAEFESISAPSEATKAHYRRLAAKLKTWGGRDGRSVPHTTRKLVLTRITDSMPPVAERNVVMVEIGTDTSSGLPIRYFKYTSNSPQERKCDKQFFRAITITYDHTALGSILAVNPYHVPSLLQLSSVLVQQGRRIDARALVERALFVFDRGSRAGFLFSGLSADCRIPFEAGLLNRQLYLAIFRMIELLTVQGTFHTALQFCKQLLALSPEQDPYGVRYFIDFYAVMAGEYKYLVDFAAAPLVSLYPIWFTVPLAFSVALCWLCIADEAQEAQEKAEAVQAEIQAAAALQRAFTLYPWAGAELCSALGVGVGLEGLAGLRGYAGCPLAQEIATEAYLVRCHVMWERSSGSKKFLEREVRKIVASPVWRKTVALQMNSVAARKAKVPDNLLRYCMLSGEPRIMARVPESVWKERGGYEYDPLPPDTGIDLDDYMDDDDAEFLEDTLSEEVIRQLIAQMEMREGRGGEGGEGGAQGGGGAEGGDDR